MTKAYAVIGSGYGDEGKGLFTDYLSNKVETSIVVRFNGGAQAGHTVTYKELKHVFGHFGSNSFLDNATTFLSHFYVVNPMVFIKEKQELESKKTTPTVVVNENCYVTTPFDIAVNQWLEEKRSDGRHGSCGLGFGETIERCETETYSLTVKDLLDPVTLKEKLLAIRDIYFKERIKLLGLEEVLLKPINGFWDSERMLDRYMAEVESFISYITISMTTLPVLDLQQEMIFEGAQGLLLDQHMGAFPYVTRSNTGLKNIIELIKDQDINKLEVIYATRCYSTRHGAGPLSNSLEEGKIPYPHVYDPTNTPNAYQGTMKFAYLDLDILKETLNKDLESVKIPDNLQLTCKLGISCLDQTTEVKFYEAGKLHTLSRENFIEHMKKTFNMPVLTSMGPSRMTITEV